MLENLAMFWFIGAVVVALFAFLSVASWAGIRAEERKTVERYTLLRKVAEQPGESARLVLERLRAEDEEAAERRAARRSRQRLEKIQAGVVLIVVGVGLGVMLEAVGDSDGLWTVGLIPGLVGVVLVLFSWFSRPDGIRS
jgi:Flp pilus assembly protein TadB